jgi:predicted ATPase
MTEPTEPRARPPLVGRDRELARLKSALANSISGPGKLLVLEGEAGIGKTRLMEELIPAAEEMGLDVVLVHCTPLKTNDPYGVFTDLIGRKRSSAGLTGEETTALDVISRDRPKDEGEMRVDLLRFQSRIFELVSQFLLRLTEKKPLCVLIDDLHNADMESLKLLHYAVKSLEKSKIFFCGTYRSEELEVEGIHPLRDLIQRMSRERRIETISLGRLGHDDVNGMIDTLFPTNRFSGELLDKIFNESEGNPLFIEELLNTMEEEGAIYREKGEWVVVENFDLLEIPTTIRDIVSRRILRLGSDAITALRWASVIGEDFSFELLKDIAEMDEQRMFNVLDELLHDKLIVEDEEAESYRFAHGKIREVTYETFTRGKSDMHHKVGSSLEKLAANRIMDVIYELAYHFSLTNDNEKIVHYSMLAGKKAMGTYALNEAYTYYIRALERLARFEVNLENKKRRLETVLNLGDIHVGLGEMDKALGYYKEVVSRSEELGDEKKMAMAYGKMGEIFGRKGEYEDSFKQIGRSLEIAERNDDLDCLFWDYYNLGMLETRKSDYEKAIEFFEKSLKYAQETNNYSDIGAAYFAFAELHRVQRDYDKALEYAKTALENWIKNRDFRIAYVYDTLGGVSLIKGKNNEAIDYYSKAIEHSRKTGDTYIRGCSSSGISEAYIENGAFESAIEFLDMAMDIFKAIDAKEMIATVYRKLGIVNRYKKEWDLSKDYFEKSIEIFEKLNIPLFTGETLYDFGLMYKDMDDEKEMSIHLNRALEIFRKLNNNPWIKKVERELVSSDA